MYRNGAGIVQARYQLREQFRRPIKSCSILQVHFGVREMRMLAVPDTTKLEWHLVRMATLRPPHRVLLNPLACSSLQKHVA